MAGGRDGRGARWPAERAKVEGRRVATEGPGVGARADQPPLINPLLESLGKLGGRAEAHAPSRLRLHPTGHQPSSPAAVPRPSPSGGFVHTYRNYRHRRSTRATRLRRIARVHAATLR